VAAYEEGKVLELSSYERAGRRLVMSGLYKVAARSLAAESDAVRVVESMMREAQKTYPNWDRTSLYDQIIELLEGMSCESWLECSTVDGCGFLPRQIQCENLAR
jgi:hypothetical protein